MSSLTGLVNFIGNLFYKYAIPNGIDFALEGIPFLSQRDKIFIETMKPQTNPSPLGTG